MLKERKLNIFKVFLLALILIFNNLKFVIQHEQLAEGGIYQPSEVTWKKVGYNEAACLLDKPILAGLSYKRK